MTEFSRDDDAPRRRTGGCLAAAVAVLAVGVVLVTLAFAGLMAGIYLIATYGRCDVGPPPAAPKAAAPEPAPPREVNARE
jgi:hypothetical protein